MMKRTTALIRTCALCLCVATAACERPTAVALTVDAGTPPEPGCIVGLEHAMGGVDTVRRLTPSEGTTAEEVSIHRGMASVNVHRESASAQLVRIEFGTLGPMNEQQQNENVALLVDVRDAVLRNCGMDARKVRVTGVCGGPVCELPEVQAMTK